MSQRFPSPIGGTPMAHDFAPSILFAALYGVLALLGIYRLTQRRTRSVLVFSSLAFVIERVVIWSLRAKQAHTPAEATSRGLTVYWQISFGVGYLAAHERLLAFLRCLAVSTTRGAPAPAPEAHELAAVPAYGAAASPALGKDPVHDAPAARRWWCAEKGCGPEGPEPQVDDAPRRKKYRDIFGLVALVGLAPVIMGPIAGNMYKDAETDASKVPTVRALRYATAAVALLLLQIFHVLCIWLVMTVPRINRHAVALLFVVATILQLIPTYHLVIVGNWTTSLTSTAVGSMNTGGEKAAFYVLQALPELVANSVLLIVNSKSMFHTGNWGDRSKDPKPKRSENEAQPQEAAPVA
ncbi:hypothetical protein PsYK624_110960 [Phanerochaete sordida]|uniref:Uncharacterized protein n=1 Tax=Phanerochaete sordida TaxID=48140 RepID=A0A9P3GJW4_9APHY|nr:hypothetical protein PsYK624_110960 [Phanerochaete sordida]